MDNWKRYELFFTASVKDQLTQEQVSRYVKPLYEEEGFQNVYETTKKKKMLPYVASMLVRAGVDEVNWQPVMMSYRKRNYAVIDELNVLYDAMWKAGVRKMFVSENFGALLNSGRDIGLFASGDMDNCADYSEKEKIDSVFESLGYRCEDRYSGKTICTSSYYNQKCLPDNFYIGLCWEPLSRLKLPCFINMDDFVNWENLRTYKDTAIRLPSVEALLYICLMHITLHTFHRAPAIRLYADILNSCYNNDVNWEIVYGWARRDQTVTRMMTSAILANKLAEVPIPDFVKAYEEDKRVRRLIRYVYNPEVCCLNPEPGKNGVYKIEIGCNDRSDIAGLTEMLYPGKEWLKRHYGHGIMVSTLLHLKNII